MKHKGKTLVEIFARIVEGGRRGGSAAGGRKAAQARKNGAKGGRPKRKH
tara:strand:+ start:1130 stop:1276 length:147 start_codon:yes stop_codon:yes gene_type:complete